MLEKLKEAEREKMTSEGKNGKSNPMRKVELSEFGERSGATRVSSWGGGAGGTPAGVPQPRSFSSRSLKAIQKAKHQKAKQKQKEAKPRKRITVPILHKLPAKYLSPKPIAA